MDSCVHGGNWIAENIDQEGGGTHRFEYRTCGCFGRVNQTFCGKCPFPGEHARYLTFQSDLSHELETAARHAIALIEAAVWAERRAARWYGTLRRSLRRLSNTREERRGFARRARDRALRYERCKILCADALIREGQAKQRAARWYGALRQAVRTLVSVRTQTAQARAAMVELADRVTALADRLDRAGDLLEDVLGKEIPHG